MSAANTANFLTLSLPGNVSPSNSSQTLSSYLEKELVNGRSVVTPFTIPDFKIGTLDSLIQQSEQLEKLDTTITGFLSKINDIFSNLYDNNQSLILSNKKLNSDQSPVQFVESFHWDSNKYQITHTISQLIDTISADAFDLDADLKTLNNSYNAAKSNLLAANRKKNGDLTVVSLHDIVGPQDFVLGSDHLQTVLVVVPKSSIDIWWNTYEHITQFVVPRLSKILQSDSDYYLVNVTLFKKFIPEFLIKCRELKFIPREFNYSEKLVDQMRKDYAFASRQEAQLRNQLIRLTKASFSDILSAWLHIKTLRVFVESVLRYGLPANFQSFLLRFNNASDEKLVNSAKHELIEQFGYLAGNAFAKDKHGNVITDNSALHQYSSIVDADYEPFVLYDFSVN